MDFDYLDRGDIYLDSACQTLRPQQVIDAQADYFTQYNACAGRVKYAWGKKVDDIIAETRSAMLDLVGLPEKKYTCAFTLNTTYGINLVLQQLPKGRFKRIITSEIEHNSVFIPSMVVAEKLGLERLVLKRAADGSLIYEPEQLDAAVIILNCVSNIDGRKLKNLSQLVEDAHKRGGIVLVDAAQAFAHDSSFLKSIPVDALFTSGHKMYAPSLGIIIIKDDLLAQLDHTFLGGGTVQDVSRDSFTLLDATAEPYATLEPGLQNFSGIIGLHEALKWRKTFRPKEAEPNLNALLNLHDKNGYQKRVADLLFIGLTSIPNLNVINTVPSEIISVYHDKIDSHRLAMFLSEQGIMARSGYFCCHYYAKEVMKYPPLLRFSVGLHTTQVQVGKAVSVLAKILQVA